jgi:glycosyltransferase involved in cell wall biosynthesis
MATKKSSRLKIGLVVPHIFMQRAILPHVVFSPGQLALALADGLNEAGVDVTIFTPGPVETKAKNVTADLSYFETELAGRGDSYMDLLKKHPFTFITLARQVQSELIALSYTMANANVLDVVHIYTNEEDTALPFARLCAKPVVFTHHDPFNFLVKYKNLFPKYKDLNLISMSYAQRAGMPKDTNWVANIYHGLSDRQLKPVANPTNDYLAYFGRIIQPKGLHLAIDAVKKYNSENPPVKFKIAGKHYDGHRKDTYWQEQIVPRLDKPHIEYVGFVGADDRRNFLANARALIMPSLFAEPFGMSAIETLACGTPVVALDSGALPEIIRDSETGFVAKKVFVSDGTLDESATAAVLAGAISGLSSIDRKFCRRDYEARFTLDRMAREHLEVYSQLTQ